MKTSSPEFSTPLPAAASVREPSPPPWVKRLLDVPSHPFATPNRALAARECISSSLALISVRISDADALPADDLQRITTEAYGIIRRRLQSIGRPHPIRFWNHIPDINARIDEAIDRYMVFNAGRFAAFRDWFGEPASAFPRAVATASGVGHHGKDLVIHCLAADTPGAAVDNPRQVAPYHYSKRYGPLPPCFARATRITHDHRQLVLVGGTASVRGEASVHAGDLHAQCMETFHNLASLISAARCGTDADPSDGALPEILRGFHDLRVYYVLAKDRAAIAQLIADHFPSLDHLELMQANLCRPELLVEIEGLATLTAD
ncbi:MAG TPA: hypothetical protein VIL86_10170 [Tepidisphaeraceae bacterium]